MRASPRRSLVRLVAPALFVAACAPRLALDDRPPPCAPGYGVCETTGVCVSPKHLDYSKPENQGPDAVCPIALMVRQGASIEIAVPGATGRDIELVSAADLIANVSWQPPAPASIVVNAPHGTFPGDGTKQGGDRTIRFRTTSGGVTIDRLIKIIVSPIAAAVTGDNGAIGSQEHPFRTFAHAAEIAEPGDTIVLSNGTNGAAADGKDAPPITLKPGITVKGLDEGKTLLYMKLTLLGDATFERVYFNRERLVITAPGTHVWLGDCLSEAGVEVAASAVGTDLKLYGDKTEIRADDGAHEPVMVAGDGSTVTIAQDVTIQFSGDGTLEPVHLTGRNQNLTVFDNAKISNSTGPRAILVEGGGTTTVSLFGADLAGRLDITHADARAEVFNGKFHMGQGLGGIYFKGADLKVQGTRFEACNGIEQENALGHVTVRNAIFKDYPRFGYHLISGQADLGDNVEEGLNEFHFEPMLGPDETPPALSLEPRLNTDSAMTVSKTKFDVMLPVSAPCRMMGPEKIPGLYKLGDNAVVSFY